MSKYWLLTSFTGLLALALACTTPSSEKQTSEVPPADTLAKNDQSAHSCPAAPHGICNQGLRFAHLGDTLVDLEVPIEGSLVQDTLYHASGYYWRAFTVAFAEGEVIIEGDFIDERSATDQQVLASQVNRVRVEAPFFRTEAGIRVGSSFNDLLRAFPEEDFFFDPIPEFQVLQVQVGARNIFYLLREETPELATGDAGIITPDMIPQDARISAIVVM